MERKRIKTKARKVKKKNNKVDREVKARKPLAKARKSKEFL